MTTRETRDFDRDEMLDFCEGSPSNYYGAVAVWRWQDRYWMGVENWDGWSGDEIGVALYKAFIKEFKATRNAQK